ncbi:hypothetical protein BCR44DRAFT_1433446 [Catenaria anguillulae PL171]|uniref:Uncharacterized protein n=1 Tax=Catenaria anguillulae PL171 TaxID=765915 RepID=A0A1Y2HMB1_9FUNG|nr:hypothetical protein BCR44DRAFT_1433446 [Catenaria anguillulae PL171]
MDPNTLNTVTKGLESSIAATGQLLAKLASRPSPDEAIQLTATVVSVILPGQQGALNTLLNLNQFDAPHAHGGYHHPQQQQQQHHHQLTAERDNALAQADALQRELANTRAERNDLVSRLHLMERELERAHHDRMQLQHQHPYRVSSAPSSSATLPATLPRADPSASHHVPSRGQQHHQKHDPYAMPPTGYPTIVPPRPPPPAPPAVPSSAPVIPPRRILQPSQSMTSPPLPQAQPQPVAVSTNPSSTGSRTSSAPASPPPPLHDLHPLPPPPPGSVMDQADYSPTTTCATDGKNAISTSFPSEGAVKVELAHAQKRSLDSHVPSDCQSAEWTSTVNGAAGEQQQDIGNHKRPRVEGPTAASPELVTVASPPPQYTHRNLTPKLPPLPVLPNATPAHAPAAPVSNSYALAAEYQQQVSLPATSPHYMPRSPAITATSAQQAPATPQDDEPTSSESLPKIRLLFKPNSSTLSSPPSPSVTMADTSFYSTSGDPDASFTSTGTPQNSASSPAQDPAPAHPDQLALPTRALSSTILSSMKHFPMRYINGILQLTDTSTRVLAHDLIPIAPASASSSADATHDQAAAKIRKYLAVTNHTLANTSLCLMQVMLARGLGVPIPHAWLLEAIMRTSGSKRSAAMRACHVAWLKPVYIVDEVVEGEGDDAQRVRHALEAKYCAETGTSEVPPGARVVVTLGVECVGLESPRADSVPPKLEVREYVLRERWALVHRETAA